SMLCATPARLSRRMRFSPKRSQVIKASKRKLAIRINTSLCASGVTKSKTATKVAAFLTHIRARIYGDVRMKESEVFSLTIHRAYREDHAFAHKTLHLAGCEIGNEGALLANKVFGRVPGADA